jgi:membrane protein YqaA with SNARE-associated domain
MSMWWSTFGLCILSALIPIVNAELILLGAVTLAPRGWAIPLAVAATLGQMIGKVVIYHVGKGAVRLPGRRIQATLRRAEARLNAHQGTENGVYFLSALLGIPPYYLIAITSGMMHYPLPRFILLGFVGRFIRFSALALAPEMLAHWLSWAHWPLWARWPR